MSKFTFILTTLFAFPLLLSAQVDIKPSYTFTPLQKVECTSVKSQGKTGTCWSFATASFLESEVIKTSQRKTDFSEMFVVRNIYLDKAQNFVLRQGKANFSQGSLSHDLMNIAATKGMIPEAAFSGISPENQTHNHRELANVLTGFLEGLIKTKRLSPKWKNAVASILDVYLGSVPTEFYFDGKKYNPVSFAKEMGIKEDNYLNFTSFTHHPFYENFILEIPDNYSNGEFYNVPLDNLGTLVDEALENGFSVAWDGDVSEKGFSQNEGLAILPEDPSSKNLFNTIMPEINVDQRMRQEGFESYATTDDHLMHLVGSAKDQKGNKYYLIKNSWGEKGPYKGYLYMSEAYFNMKTVSIMMNKNALNESTKKNIQL